MAGKKKNFTPEFRDEASREVVDNSRSIASVARGIGVSETTLGNWVRAYRERHAGEEPPLEMSERARLREAERGVRNYDKSYFPGKSSGVLRVGAAVSDKYTLIAAEYAANMAAPAADAPTLTKMCLWIGVSKSGFYDWKDRPLSATAERQEYLKGKIEKIFGDNDETYGYRRVHAELARQGDRPAASSSAV